MSGGVLLAALGDASRQLLDGLPVLWAFAKVNPVTTVLLIAVLVAGGNSGGGRRRRVPSRVR